MKNVLPSVAYRAEIVIFGDVGALFAHSLTHKEIRFVLKCTCFSLNRGVLGRFYVIVDSYLFPVLFRFFFQPWLNVA